MNQAAELMETFDQIWESSRYNVWSSGYSTVVWLGLAAVVVASLLPWTWIRRGAVLLTILGFTYQAAYYAELEIFEKWRIRREWAAAHFDQMTDAQKRGLTTDSANLLLGPIYQGFGAMTLFVAAAIGLMLTRIVLRHFMSQGVKPDNLPASDVR